MLEKRIEQDLKTALLSGDRITTETLRGVKSALLYFKVEKGKREEGLSEEDEISVLKKEAKKRTDSAELYLKGGREDKAEAELNEKKIIDQYLPAEMADEELIRLIEESIKEENATDISAMGKVIASVKQKSAGQADGSKIASLVKERLVK